MLTELDRSYCVLVGMGFIALREAMAAKDFQWMQSDVEFLHNVPSLIGEANVARHEYFWTKERPHYLEIVATRGSESQKSWVRSHYGTVLDTMTQPIAAILARGTTRMGRA